MTAVDRSTASAYQTTESVTLETTKTATSSAIIDSTINNNIDGDSNITTTSPSLPPTTAQPNTTPGGSTCLHCGCSTSATVGTPSLVRFKFQTSQNKSLLCIIDTANNFLWTVSGKEEPG